MASPADLPRNLRRVADRPAGPRGRRPSDQVQALADVGLLTRANTRPGTAGRRAADAVQYRRRVARGRARGITTARESVGQRVANLAPRVMSAIFRESGYAEVVDPTIGQASRLARYNARVGELVQGQITRQRFRAMVRSWRPLAGQRFEWTPTVVLAILGEREASGEPVFVYLGRRR